MYYKKKKMLAILITVYCIVSSVSSIAINDPSIRVCPKIKCDIECVQDVDYGCPKCICKVNPCATVRCASGYHCVVNNVVCIRAPCPPIAECVPNEEPVECPLIKCGSGCTVLIVNGCPTCKCNPCMTVRCISGYECIAKEVQCLIAPCDTIGVCVPISIKSSPVVCPVVKCDIGCVEVMVEGCPQCDCTANPCATIDCSPGYECVTKEVQCFVAPCNPIGECVPLTPRVDCPAVNCDIGCVEITVDGCPQCDCNTNSCEAVTCEIGSDCVMTHVLCKRLPCLPLARCVPRSIYLQ